ncbi:hypothetical protein PAXRUDRAFT_178624 [Paxillus rubicundulus Ve08.2h10]|uniref:Uncharacterized protein n=1 Tax=Paxillus rubicundulus Ve08.2h10 TaxID=930991 RepID=A0A0D0D8G6_9AGAM|nr:hypothetical protein PAXRUDRAFT_178624 [Paxillus rubicundulus Ve08.2h10]
MLQILVEKSERNQYRGNYLCKAWLLRPSFCGRFCGCKGEKVKMEKDPIGALVLPPYSSLKLPGQKDAMRQIMHEAYGKHSIEYCPIAGRTDGKPHAFEFIHEDYLPDDLDKFPDPSKLVSSQVQPIWDLWLAHQAKGEQMVVFIRCKKGDLRADVEGKLFHHKKGKKKNYTEIYEENVGGHPAAHASDQQTQVAFLQTLSKAKSYQDLVLMSTSIITKPVLVFLFSFIYVRLNISFSWQWASSCLSVKLHNLHLLKATLVLFSQAVPTSHSSRHFGKLTLALGLLLCDITKVIELEPNINPIPPYFGQSPCSHQHLDWVLATVEVTKGRITAAVTNSKRSLPADVSTLSLLPPKAVMKAQESTAAISQEITVGAQDRQRTPALNKLSEGSKEIELEKKHGMEDHQASSAAKKPWSQIGNPQSQAQGLPTVNQGARPKHAWKATAHAQGL